MNPTSLTFSKLDRSEVNQSQFTEMKILLNSLFLNVDFKDIDLIYYLLRRYERIIAPALIVMGDPLCELLHE